MSKSTSRHHEGGDTTDRTVSDPDDRDVRAVVEYLTVLEDVGPAAGAPDLYYVVSESGENYTVDARTGACECPDATYRDVKCKHSRRVEIVRGERPVPAGVAPEDVDDQLGEHVDGEVRHVATDGGAVEADDGAEVLATPETDGPVWEGPFTEYDKYGQPTGHAYARCRGCGVEVLTGSKENAAHRDGCPRDDV